jgi:hypothetical protein
VETVKTYRVTAPCVVHVPVAAPTGTTFDTLYQDAVFTGDPDSEKIRHLLDSDMIVPVGGDAATADTTDTAATADPAAGGTAGTDTRRRQELTEPQVAPVTARSSKSELVDYAVSQGMDRTEAEKLTVKELQERYVPKQ